MADKGTPLKETRLFQSLHLILSYRDTHILVGLSGGVDSSAAVALLLEQGHEVVEVYMKSQDNEKHST